jgi:hypothetical protein
MDVTVTEEDGTIDRRQSKVRLAEFGQITRCPMLGVWIRMNSSFEASILVGGDCAICRAIVADGLLPSGDGHDREVTALVALSSGKRPIGEWKTAVDCSVTVC